MKNKSSIIILSLAATLGLFGGFQEYKYDANGRLSGVSGSTDESYAYDSRGNVAQIKKGGEVISFEYDAANQLKQRTDADGVHTFTYDRAGRLTEEALNGQSVARYTYGYLDKVTAVERKGQTTRFRYNADGMLIEKQYPDGKIEKWSWDGLGLVARGDERYINEPHASGGTPVMSLTVKGVRYHTSDYLGTTLCSTDAQGKVTDRYESTAYGQGGGLQEDPSARFTGKPYDKDLGAFVFPFRNYDSKNVRWFSVDPSGFPDGSNPHFYACNPLTQIDPFGLVKYSIINGENTWVEYNFIVDVWTCTSTSFTYTNSHGDTVSASITSTIGTDAASIAREIGVSVEQIHSSSIQKNYEWVKDTQRSVENHLFSGTPAKQFDPSSLIPSGWAFDTWITAPTDQKVKTETYQVEYVTDPAGDWRWTPSFTDWKYAYSFQIKEM